MPPSHAVEVLEPDADVVAQALLGDLAAGDATSSSSAALDRDLVALPLELVRPVAEHRVELLERDRDEVRVRDPGAVEAVAGLALLVLAHLRERALVQLGVAAGSG